MSSDSKKSTAIPTWWQKEKNESPEIKKTWSKISAYIIERQIGKLSCNRFEFLKKKKNFFRS